MERKSSDRAQGLSRLENAVCESLRRLQAGTVDPYAHRVENAERELLKLGNALGFRYAEATLSNFQATEQKQRDALDRLISFAADMPDHLRQSGGLLLFGPPGTGKDHLLAALLKIAVARHKLEVEFFDGGSLFDEFYFSLRSDSESSLKDLQRRLHRPHVLAISDPQPPQGELSDAQIRRLRDAIDVRYRRGLSTWITTNLDSRPDAVSILTEPVLQRLKEGSAVIDCNWGSFRESRRAAW